VVLAEIVLMAFGFAWLALGAQMASGATGIGFAKAWAAGVQPFLLGDLIKAALAASLVGAGWSVLKRRG
jgi:biotin transport system substrate-specific component